MSIPIDTLRLPPWFSQAFAHLSTEGLQIAARLRQEEAGIAPIGTTPGHLSSCPLETVCGVKSYF